MPDEIDVSALEWDRELHHSHGSAYWLDNIDVLCDFHWHELFPHQGIRFQHGLSLARSVRRSCPDGKRPVLVLSDREDVEAMWRRDDRYFFVVVNIHRYIEQSQSDPALTFFARAWQSAIPDIEQLRGLVSRPELMRVLVDEHLEPEHIRRWLEANPEHASVLDATSEQKVSSRPTSQAVILATRALNSLNEALGSASSGIPADDPSLEELLTSMTRFISHLPRGTIDTLRKLGPEDLHHVSALLGASRLKRFLDVYNDNRSNSVEGFWQETLEQEAWVISQLFCSPMIIMRGQAYVGGKAINNQGGQLADFVYCNAITRNPALIEIKTPAEQLLGGEYRNGVYPPSRALSGTVAQLLTQQQELQENIAELQRAARLQADTNPIEAFRPRSLAIVGSIEAQNLADAKLRSFELYRSAQKDIEIVTFDELALKVQHLLDLLLENS